MKRGYTVVSYDSTYAVNVEADSVYVDGVVAVFSKNVVRNQGQTDEYSDIEVVASFDITKVYFVVAEKETKKVEKK